MEKIYFDDSTFIWRAKLGYTQYRSQILDDAQKVIDSMPDLKSDGFGFNNTFKTVDFIGNLDIKTRMDEITQMGINKCKELYADHNIEYNKVNTDAWVNVVRAKDPVQSNFKDGNDFYHTHTEIQKQQMSFYPHYTYVYYLQMPNNLKDDEGALYIKGENDKDYWFIPEEDELVIMPGDIPHSPNVAPNSTVDRIVIAGNVGFDFIKKEKSLI